MTYRMQNHKLWLLGSNPEDEPIEVNDVDPNKASMIYLSGVGDFVSKKPSFTNRRSLLSIAESTGVDKRKYNFYTVSSRYDAYPEDILDSIDNYNAAPKSYKREGEELYNLIVKSRIPDKKDDQGSFNLFLSTLNFIGHSAGSAFLGQYRNAVKFGMRDAGYSEVEIGDSMNCMSGCYIAPSRELQKSIKKGIPSVYAVSGYDFIAERRGDFKKWVKDDNHPRLKHAFLNRAIVMMSELSPVSISSLKLRKNEESLVGFKDISLRDIQNPKVVEEYEAYATKKYLKLRDEVLASNIEKWKISKKGVKPIPTDEWKIILEDKLVSDEQVAHSTFRHTNTTKFRKDIAAYLFQAEPFAHIIIETIKLQLETSMQSVESGKIRDGLKILHHIEDNFLTVEAKNKAAKMVEDADKMANELFDGFTGTKSYVQR